MKHLQRNINPLKDFLAFWALFAVLRRGHFDIAHTNTAKAGVLGRIAARFSGIKKVYHMPHGHNFYGYYCGAISAMVVLIERFAGLFCDKLIVLTELAKRDFVKYNIKREGEIKVVRSGLEIEELERVEKQDKPEIKEKLGFPRKKQLIGMVSRLERVKGCEYFIEAISLIAKKLPEAHFIIAGDGSLVGKLIERISVLKLDEIVSFTGWREDSLEIISVLDVLVQPSLNEAVGRVLLEAQALGVPVVGTKAGGIPEVIKDGHTGLLVEPENAEAIARAVCEILDFGRFSQVKDNAKDWVRNNYTAEKMVNSIYEIYENSV
jgi:glycosyltransferase involved in cell wall biosynthesis